MIGRMTAAILLFGVSLLIAVLAGLVLYCGPRGSVQRTFAFAALSVAAWSLTNALFQLAASDRAALLWANLSYVSAVGIGASFFRLSWVFPSGERFPLGKDLALWASGLAASALPFIPGLVVSGVSPDRRLLTHWGLYPIAGFILGTFLFAFGRLIRSYGRARGEERQRLGVFTMGAALTASFGVLFNLLLPLRGDYRYVAFSPAFSLCFVATTAYAVVVHRLFDVRVVLRKALVYGLLLAFVLGAYSSALFLFTQYLTETAGKATQFAVLIIAFSVGPLRRFLEERATHLLFPRRRPGKGRPHPEANAARPS
jgi:hypothetical protein